MRFRHLSCLNRGLALSLNNLINYLNSPEFSASGDILVLSSHGSTEVEQQYVYQCLKGMFCPF